MPWATGQKATAGPLQDPPTPAASHEALKCAHVAAGAYTFFLAVALGRPVEIITLPGEIWFVCNNRVWAVTTENSTPESG